MRRRAAAALAAATIFGAAMVYPGAAVIGPGAAMVGPQAAWADGAHGGQAANGGGDTGGGGGGTSISFRVPGQAQAGAAVMARGRIAGLDGRGSVQAQLLSDGRWRTVARLGAGDGRYRLQLRLPSHGTTATVRGVVIVAGRRVATSSRSRVRLRSGSRAEPPAPSAGQATSSAASGAPPAPVEPAPPPEPEPGPEPPIQPFSSSVVWGAWINPGTGEQPAPINEGAISSFEGEVAQKRPSILESYSAFFQCSNGSGGACSREYAFPQAQLEAIRQRGAIPLFTWASESSSGEVNQSDFQLADLIAGSYDSYIRKWAEAAKAWRHPFFLRFDWEMNGTWYPWAEGVNGNQPGEYVAAWRHVHDIFTAAGATNVTWLWCPFVNPNGNLAEIEDLYPGDEYVDWTGLDGYNHGTSKGANWRSFEYLFRPQYEEITATIAPSKPFLVPEVASAEQGGSKPEWIEEMFEVLPTVFPAVRGLLWFDYEENGYGYPLELSPAAEAAFAAGIADPRYLAGSIGGPLTLP